MTQIILLPTAFLDMDSRCVPGQFALTLSLQNVLLKTNGSRQQGQYQVMCDASATVPSQYGTHFWPSPYVRPGLLIVDNSQPKTKDSVEPLSASAGGQPLHRLLPPFRGASWQIPRRSPMTLEYVVHAMWAFFTASPECPIALNFAMILSSKTKS